MQQLRPIYWFIIPGCILLTICFLLLPVTAPRFVPDKNHPTVYLLYASAGSMSQLLNTGQIDAFIIWEPVVTTAELAGIGKHVAVPSDIPPPGKWTDAASCVLVLRKDVTEQYPDISALISALTTAAINRTRENPELAEKITAYWIFGKGPILTSKGSLSPLDVEHHSFGNTVFTANVTPPESGIVRHALKTKSDGTYNPADMMNPAVSVRGRQFLNGSAVPGLAGDIPTLNLGYLPSCDNFAPLHVMVRD